MPIKFDFISPDIVVREVDQSVLPPEPANDGILIIGQAIKGPAMKPVKIKTVADLESVFGATNSGVQPPGDIWRAGNYARPSYGLYAAKAWLASETSPVTYIRLAGDSTTTTTTKAGWNLGGAAASTSNPADIKLAYGLWICPSASAEETSSGTLGAIIYTKGAALSLSGTIAGSSDTTSSAGVLIESEGTSKMAGFTLDVWTAADSSVSKSIHFDPGANGFIRDSLNSDPHKLQSGQKGSDESYFLGESFETEVFEVLQTAGSASAGKQYGILMPLSSGSIAGDNWAERNRKVTASKTGWFVENYSGPSGSYANTALKKLFRLVSLHEGEEFQKKYYVEIELRGIQSVTSEYTSFMVSIKSINGDLAEGPYKCSLDPNSDNFIAKKIGDQYLEYNSTKKKFITKGNFPNVSSLVRVEMHQESSDSLNNSIPFGFYGPYKPKSFTITSGSSELHSGGTGAWAVSAISSSIYAGHDASSQFALLAHDVTCSFSWPELKLTDTNSNGGTGRLIASGEALGVRNYRRNIADTDYEIYEVEKSSDYLDLTRNYQEGIDPHSSTGGLELSFIFSLDEVKEGTNGAFDMQFSAGSHADGTSYTAMNSTADLINAANGKLKMVAPFFGGFDGVNIEYVNPFKNSLVTGTKLTNYEYEAIDRALDFAANSEYLQYDLIAMPGITNTTLVRKLAQNTANRADALAIIDINSGFSGKHENAGTDTLGSIATVETAMNSLRFNNSYAATYYPEVEIVDKGKVIVPSSIAGIGAIAKSEAATGAPWFAPAGFNRGGISVLGGSSGPVVSAPAETLTKAERDRLYQVNVNPIANFPGEGPVVFGQKTLQRTASALDRINVRRLLIYLKKTIGVVARTVLFDANLQATWNRFVASATPILADAKAGFGIAEYKLVLDETTTTPDLVDRNIMYAQIYIKPAYAIEFIAIDFTITRSGIEF